MKAKTFLALLVLVVMTGCNDEQGSSDFKPISLSRAEEMVANQANQFSLDFVNKAKSIANDDNFVVSPLSASIAMSMVTNGASAETRDELVDALGFAGDIEALNTYYCTLISKLPKMDKKVQLYLPNAFWQADFKAKGDFKKVLSEYYKADIMSVKGDNYRESVNTWVERETHGMIKNFVNEAPAATNGALLFANVLYFNGKWSTPFEKNKTQTGIFFNANDTKAYVPFMKGDHVATHMDGETYHGIVLPYGNGAFSMYFLLPNSVTVTPDNVLSDLAKNGLPEPGAEMLTSLQIPKFRVDYNFDLIPLLKSMGVNRFFANADFSNICDDTDLRISWLRQKTIMEVEENGTVAVSVTGAVADPTGNYIPQFILNRPFIFLIVEQSTKTVLLAGRVNKL